MVYLADDCNLSCTYCYEGNNKNNKRISQESLEKAFDFIVKVNNDNEIDITFLGGEPMLNKKMIYYAVEMKKKYNVPFNYSITTNGTCCNYEDIIFMNENKFDISLSIDGTKETHERNRCTKIGSNLGFYEKIMSNLNYMINNQIPFTVRMTVTCNNVMDLYNNVLYFFEMGVERFNIAFNEFEKWDMMSLRTLDQQLFLIDSWYLKNQSSIVCLDIFDGKITFFIANRKPLFCNAGTKRHFVINSSGDFFPCNYVCNNSNWQMGNIETEIDQKYCFEKIKENVSKENKCTHCDIGFACIGRRCGFKNYALTGKLNVPDNNLCNLEKILFKHNELVFTEMYHRKDERFMKFYDYAVQNKIKLSEWMLQVLEGEVRDDKNI